MSDPTKRPLSEWLADLEDSEAEADAGLIKHLEAKARERRHPEAV